MKELSVVIPAYNEGKVVCRNLQAVDQYLQTLGLDYEIVVVNDGSGDDTLSQLTAMTNPRLIVVSYTQNKGKGFAVNRGMTAASGRFRLFMDMDLSTALTEIPQFLKAVREEGCDICVGNRHHIRLLQQQRPWHRALLGKIFVLLSSAASGCRLEDYTCGFKIFTAEACAKVFPQQDIYNWAFDTQLMAIARAQGLRIEQRPVAWHHHDNSKVRIAAAMGSSLVSLFKIAMNRRTRT